MSTKMILIILCVFTLICNCQILAQKDSVIIEKSTESISESDYNKKRKYKYIDQYLREEKTLIKLGLSPLSGISLNSDHTFNSDIIFGGNISGTLSFEQKINPSISIILNNNFKYSEYGSEYLGKYFSNDIGIRYYYSISKKIRKNLGRNNFHSNYFSIKLERITSYTYTKSKGYFYSNGTTESSTYTYYNSDWIFEPNINISWGMQRRIGKWWFIDLGPYISYKSYSTEFSSYKSNFFEFGFDLQLGFAWGK